MAWTAPASFSVGEIVTATKLNTHVRDNMLAMAPVSHTSITSYVTISGTATSYSTATAILAGETLNYDARPILVEFYTPKLSLNSAGLNLYVGLFDSTTHVATLAHHQGSSNVDADACYAAHRFTPTAASHTYNIRAWGDATHAVWAGTGAGAGALAPAFLRIRYDEF